MPINPAIAMGVQPIQLADPLAQYGKIAAIQQAQNQNALAQYQLGAAQREETAQNALSEAYKAAFNPQTGAYDINKLRGAVISAGAGARLPAIEKAMSELRTQQLTQQKTEGEVVGGRTKEFRDLLVNVNNPATAAQWLEAQYKDPVLGPVVSRVPFEQAVSQIPTEPTAFNDWKSKHSLGMAEFIKQNAPKYFSQNLGGTERIVSIPGLGGAATVVPGTTETKTLTPGEAKPTVSNIDVGGATLTQEYDPVTRTTRIIGRQAKTLTPEQARAASQEKTKVAHTTTDEAGNVTLYNMFGEVIGAKDASGAPIALKGKPSATFEKTRNQREQLSKDLDTAIAELKDITKEGGLIDQSTGSGAGRAVDVAAGFFGKATPGAIATAKLAPIADLALKMVPRFEGPQSDKDTASYKQAAGQLADPSLPSAIRKEAGKTVLRLMENRKGQFVTQGMAAEGTAAGGGVDTSNPLLK